MTVIKAIACERPEKRNQPLSRYSLADIRDIAVHQESFETISVSTVWRILAKDAIRPWRYRYWIFPRDPLFFEKAEPILGLYEGIWQGRPLSKWMFVLSADEKTSIQGRYRCPAAKAPAPGQLSLFEHGYQRLGALQYLAAWDVHRGKVFGHCEARTGKVSFRRLVEQLMSQEPYRSADQVFWIVDNSSSHRGPQAAKELNELYPNATLLHLPVHASWLNQIEIYFGIVQRKVLTPNEFKSLPELAYRLSAFEKMINAKSKPFGWKFTRQDLQRRLKEFKLAA